MTAPRLTPAMVAALRLASEDAIRYYKGGWYTIPDCSISGPYSAPGTLESLVSRGLLDAFVVPITSGTAIYAQRWTITDAGRDALANLDAEGREGR